MFDAPPPWPASSAHPPSLFSFLQIVLETEENNTAALALYERLGFVRDKRLHKYYLNGHDAYRLKLWLK